MSRLEEKYNGQVDFIHIDWDDPDSQIVIDTFGAPGRSTYLLINPSGKVLWTFVGELDEQMVVREIDAALRD